LIEEPDPARSQRQARVDQDLVPSLVPQAEIDDLVDLLDQSLLGGKVAVDDRLGQADELGEIPRASIEAELRKELGGLQHDLPAPLLGRQAFQAVFCRCCLGSALGCRSTGHSVGLLRSLLIGSDRREMSSLESCNCGAVLHRQRNLNEIAPIHRRVIARLPVYAARDLGPHQRPSIYQMKSRK